MKKAEMLNLRVGSKIENKKGQWIINEISFEVFDKETDKYMYGTDRCESYQETQFDLDESRTRVVRFFVHQIGKQQEMDTMLREVTVRDCFKVVEY